MERFLLFGYYRFQDTGFYYLKSRYYDPAICRFINADAFASTGQGFIGTNMFAYCLNNPVCLKDTSGHLSDILNATGQEFSVDLGEGIEVVIQVDFCGTFSEEGQIQLETNGKDQISFSVSNSSGENQYYNFSLDYSATPDSLAGTFSYGGYTKRLFVSYSGGRVSLGATFSIVEPEFNIDITFSFRLKNTYAFKQALKAIGNSFANPSIAPVGFGNTSASVIGGTPIATAGGGFFGGLL